MRRLRDFWVSFVSFLNALSQSAERAGLWNYLWLILFAIAYYGSYALSGLALRGEGGTIAVIAQRILSGERPFADTFLGYNLFWFYPIVWLFSITGPNFLVVRLFFFLLSIITGLLGYQVVWRVTGRPLLSLLAAIIIILIPGMQFRSYMGLLGVGNLLFLIEVFVLEKDRKSRLLWLIGSGLLLGFTFLVRVDLGILFSVLVICSALFYPFIDLANWRRRCAVSLLSLLTYSLLITIVHLPVDRYAAAHGFEKEFWVQYEAWGNDLVHQLNEAKRHSVKALGPPARTDSSRLPGGAVSGEKKSNEPDADSTNERGTRPRPSIKDIFFAPTTGNRHFAFLVYAPILAGGIILLLSFLLLLKDWQTRDPEPGREAFALLVSLGSALTLLPQYFLFRPDPPHVSEMMCVFVIASAVAYGIALRRRREQGVLTRIIATSFLVVSVFHLTLYIAYGIKRPSMGSIALRYHADVLVKGADGVSGYVPRDRAEEYKALYKTVIEHSSPDDYVVCYPYQPMVNFMTNRRSYLYNLYVDNATQPTDFTKQAIANFEKYKPAAILIDDVAMNQTEISRFSNWARPVYLYIQDHYELAGTCVGNEIYLRRE
jgi:hypothetical protein